MVAKDPFRAPTPPPIPELDSLDYNPRKRYALLGVAFGVMAIFVFGCVRNLDTASSIWRVVCLRTDERQNRDLLGVNPVNNLHGYVDC